MAVLAVNQSGVPIKLSVLKDLADHVIREEQVLDAEISIALVDASEMAEMNKKFRSIDKPTDVLAFDLKDSETISGEVVISPQVAYENCENGKTGSNEIKILLVHGILHLLGYDHASDEGSKQMFSRQEQLVATFDDQGCAESL
ncbi:MAG: rRNA maturation RNase YbeY [Actinomycetia bacterium]|nr:rRNA maturation RNase YbeY [Actinomycetes bacterium]